MVSGRPFPRIDARLLTSLALVSAAVTAQQIVLLQVLGWTHWHHFAYLVVAVALLGFGIAGTVLTLARDALVSHGLAAVHGLLVLAAVAMPLGVRLAQAGAVAVDLPLVFFAPENLWRLAALCGLLLPPFFAGGLVTGLLLSYHARTPGKLYAASLAGAGAGGLIGLGIAAAVEPTRVAAAAGAIAWLALLPLWRGSSRIERIGTGAAAAAVLALGVWPGHLESSQFKPLTRVLEMPGARVVASRPGLRGWVQVVAAPALRPAPAVSFNFIGEIRPQPVVFVNGLPYGSLPDAAALQDLDWLDHTTDAALFAVSETGRVLLVENGPGGWSALARRHGAREVIVVEPNRALVNLVTGGPNPLAPEWRLAGVTLDLGDGRAFLTRRNGSYEAIRLPTAGALGGSTGLGAAGEQFLLTREAVLDAWERLSRNGVLGVSVWMDFPERNPLRLLATLVEALAVSGAPARPHIAAIRSWAAVTFLVKRSPWSTEDIAALTAFCDSRGFDVLLAPGVGPERRQENHAWQNPAFFELVDALVDGPREPVYERYPFVIEPATDRRPYFSQFIRLSQLGRLREAFGARATPFFELGSLVVAVTFVLLTVLGVVCIVLPLAWIRRGVQGRAGVLLYFGGLGAGYMLVEIGAMLEAQAWLGSLVEAAALVITSLLLASGAGSLWSERLPPGRSSQRRVVPVIAGSLVLVGALFAAGAEWGRAMPEVVRLIAVLTLVTIPGFVMGMAFPIGLRRLSRERPELVPWAWAVNGCVSVATPAGALLLAMSFGFGSVFVAAVAAYLVAFLGAGVIHARVRELAE